jgi:hypothetical protein
MTASEKAALFIQSVLNRNPTPEELEKCMVIEREHKEIIDNLETKIKGELFSGSAGKITVHMNYRYWVKGVEARGRYWNITKMAKDIGEAVNAATVVTAKAMEEHNSRVEEEITKLALRYHQVLEVLSQDEEINKDIANKNLN